MPDYLGTGAYGEDHKTEYSQKTRRQYSEQMRERPAQVCTARIQEVRKVR